MSSSNQPTDELLCKVMTRFIWCRLLMLKRPFRTGCRALVCGTFSVFFIIFNAKFNIAFWMVRMTKGFCKLSCFGGVSILSILKCVQKYLSVWACVIQEPVNWFGNQWTDFWVMQSLGKGLSEETITLHLWRSGRLALVLYFIITGGKLRVFAPSGTWVSWNNPWHAGSSEVWYVLLL